MQWHRRVREKVRELDFKQIQPFPDPRAERKFYAYRSFLDWTFKFVGWLIIIGTFRYGYEKTGHLFFKIAEFGLTVAIAGLVGAFTEVFLTPFQRVVPPSWRAPLVALAFFVAGGVTHLVVSTAVDAVVTFQKTATAQKNETAK